ncbi:MAG: YceD family protein [Actinomycetota bacterium]
MTRSVLRIGVMELRRRPGTQRDVRLAVALEGLAISSAEVPAGAEVVVDAVLEASDGAVTIKGSVAAPWVGECRRCLEPVEGVLEVALDEIFESKPTEGETYPLVDDEVDLEPVLRDAVLLSLPLAPLCRQDCPGPAPEQFPAIAADDQDRSEGDASGEHVPDPRWAALEQLKFD